MTSFGIPIIDERIAGAGKVLLMHEPGTKPAPFILQAVRESLRDGRPVVYVALDHPVNRIRAGFEGQGVPMTLDQGVQFVDGWSPRMGQAPQAEHLLPDPGDLVAFTKILGRLSEAHPGSLLVLESLSTLLNEGGLPTVNSARETLFAAFSGYDRVVAVFTDWGYEEDLAWLMNEFQGDIRLHGVKERVVTEFYFTAKGPAGHAGPVPYRSDPTGGVQGYVPKIVVAGPLGAGKSTLVQALSQTMVGTEHQRTTVAGEVGRVKRRGLNLDLFGTPGHERFDPLLDVIAKKASGVLLMVDSTAPETFDRADQILHKVWKRNLPVVVAANKQDTPGALSPDELARRLSIPEDYPVVGCSKDDAASMAEALDTLIDRIFNQEVPR